VPLLFTVVNPGGSPVTLFLMGREPAADFQVSNAAGRTVWRLLHGEPVMAALRVFPIEPGHDLTFRQVWNQRAADGRPVGPGSYLVHAVLLTDDPGGLAAPPARLQIDD
jgi:hypothetical protein